MTRLNEIKKIKARADAAAEGPWKWDRDIGRLKSEKYIVLYSFSEFNDSGLEIADADAQFIAHSREDLPYLLEHIEKLHRVMWQISPAFAELLDASKETNDKT